MSSFWGVFDDVATRFGDRTAVELQRREGVERYTYRDLHSMALERAAWLAGNRIGPGDRVAILADNDARWCAAYLGILRIGAIAVPLDTNYSAKQVATIVSDSGAKILFANERLTSIALEALASSACDLAPLAPAARHLWHPWHPPLGTPGTFGTLGTFVASRDPLHVRNDVGSQRASS